MGGWVRCLACFFCAHAPGLPSAAAPPARPPPRVRQAVLPRQHPGQQQHAEAGERGEHGGDAERVAADPQHDGARHGRRHRRLIPRERAHRLQASLCRFGCVGGAGDGRRLQLVRERGREREAYERGERRRHEPGRPRARDDDAQLGGQLHAEQVLGGEGRGRGVVEARARGRAGGRRRSNPHPHPPTCAAAVRKRADELTDPWNWAWTRKAPSLVREGSSGRKGEGVGARARRRAPILPPALAHSAATPRRAPASR